MFRSTLVVTLLKTKRIYNEQIIYRPLAYSLIHLFFVSFSNCFLFELLLLCSYVFIRSVELVKQSLVDHRPFDLLFRHSYSVLWLIPTTLGRFQASSKFTSHNHRLTDYPLDSLLTYSQQQINIT